MTLAVGHDGQLIDNGLIDTPPRGGEVTQNKKGNQRHQKYVQRIGEWKRARRLSRPSSPSTNPVPELSKDFPRPPVETTEPCNQQRETSGLTPLPGWRHLALSMSPTAAAPTLVSTPLQQGEESNARRFGSTRNIPRSQAYLPRASAASGYLAEATFLAARESIPACTRVWRRAHG